MNLTQSTLQRFFTVEHKGKTYYIDYLNSDGQILEINRLRWKVLDEELEELPDYKFTKDKAIPNKKELELKIKLIKFCMVHKI